MWQAGGYKKKWTDQQHWWIETGKADIEKYTHTDRQTNKTALGLTSSTECRAGIDTQLGGELGQLSERGGCMEGRGDARSLHRHQVTAHPIDDRLEHCDALVARHGEVQDQAAHAGGERHGWMVMMVQIIVVVGGVVDSVDCNNSRNNSR